jgi:F-type H+-transporting ATPase subunit b
LKTVLFGPLEKTLAERHAATAGAVEAANRALESAKAKAAEYDAALRNARGEILRSQEAERRALADEQAAAVAKAKAQGSELIAQARAGLRAETESVRQTLANEAERLADSIVAAVVRGSRN